MGVTLDFGPLSPVAMLGAFVTAALPAVSVVFGPSSSWDGTSNATVALLGLLPCSSTSVMLTHLQKSG